MNPFAVAGVWAGAGMAAAAVLPALRLRRLGVVVPLAALAALLLAVVLPGIALPSSTTLQLPQLDRTGQGVLMATAASIAVTLVLAPTVEGRQLLTIGLVGAAAVIAVTATDPVLWALALLVGSGALALRWISVAPGRITMAAGRVAVGAGAVMLAAAPFIPVTGANTGPRPVLVAGLLVSGVAALLGLLPLGGWALGALTALRGADAAAWPFLFAPAVLLSAQRLALVLPPVGALTFGRVALTLGLLTSVWSAYQATRAPAPRRYARVYIADLGLAAAALGSGHLGLAQTGGLLLVLSHLIVGPLLIHGEQRSGALTRRISWLLLSGLPPSPAFWARFVLLEGLSQVATQTLFFTVVSMGLLFLAALMGMVAERPPARPQPASPLGVASQAAGVLLVLAGIALGAASQAGMTVVFGAS